LGKFGFSKGAAIRKSLGTTGLTLTLTPQINAQMYQNWPLGADSGVVKVKVVTL